MNPRDIKLQSTTFKTIVGVSSLEPSNRLQPWSCTQKEELQPFWLWLSGHPFFPRQTSYLSHLATVLPRYLICQVFEHPIQSCNFETQRSATALSDSDRTAHGSTMLFGIYSSCNFTMLFNFLSAGSYWGEVDTEVSIVTEDSFASVDTDNLIGCKVQWHYFLPFQYTLLCIHLPSHSLYTSLISSVFLISGSFPI